MVDKKERTKIAYDYGYRVSVEGTVTLNGNLVSIREQKKKNSDRTLLYFYFHKLKTNIYVSKLQAYQKYGISALRENCIYLDGNTRNCSYENITIKSELEKYLNANKMILCGTCHRILPYNAFYKYDIKNKTYLIKCCKECQKSKRKEKYNYIQNHKRIGCICCGEKDPACLDFHHLKDKEEQLSHMLTHSKTAIDLEINKCVVLCANCHRKLHYYNKSIEDLMYGKF